MKEYIKVLVYTRFGKDGRLLLGETWRADYEGSVVAETETTAKVKKYWFLPGEWLPKDGEWCRLKKINSY